jgi:vancomycin resistance protein YoaR
MLMVLVLGSVLLALVAFAVGERVLYRDKVLPDVRLGGVEVGGLSERDAVRRIEPEAQRLEHRPIVVQAGKYRLSVNPTAIGLRVDRVASVRAAREVGRRDALNAVAGSILRRSRADDVPFVVHVDHGRFEGVLDGWIATTGRGLVDGGLRFEGTKVITIQPKSGIGMRREEARDLVLGAVARGDDGPIAVPIGPTTPAVDRRDVRLAARRAREILSAPAVLHFEATTLIVTPEQLAGTLGTQVSHSKLLVTVDPDKLRFVLGGGLAALETPAKDASFAVNGTSVSVVPAVTGKQADLAAVGKEIASGRHDVTGAFREVQPARSTEWAQKLNITELVSSYTTRHNPGEPRVTNIHVAANVINNTIVEPGQTFSLNGALGQRTLDKGYVAAPAIGADLELEPSIGGGVSQLSTTLYNATFFGCYQDVTHTVHAYYIDRYPMGREATLNYPSIDNKFRNDSHSGLLIRTSYSSTSITVSFYGNKEGRSCHGEGPHVLQTIPVETKYIDDPALPAGQTKQLSAGHPGYAVENFRIISRPGQPDKRERYYERYSMVPARVARGTGGAPPPTTPTTAAATPPG